MASGPLRRHRSSSDPIREALDDVRAQLGQVVAGDLARPITVRSDDPVILQLVSLMDALRGTAQQAASGLDAAVSVRTAELAHARAQAERANAARGQFQATMSHEIRTAMSGMLDMNTLLLATSLDKEQRELAEAVQDSARALLRVVNEVLDAARVEASGAWLTLDLADFDIHDLLTRSVRTLSGRAREKDLDLTLTIAPDMPRLVRGDAGRVRQVVLNLLGNAVKFTERGQVAVRATALPRGIRVEIEDTGIGISPEAIARLFQKFGQADATVARRYGGTGLGLAISKELVELMGGRIDFRSTPGVGSLFWFEIMLGRVPPASVAREQAASAS